MSIRHSPRHPQRSVHSLLVALIFAIALFLVGPSAASIDDNGDGAPDVPVVVTASSSAAECFRLLKITASSANAHPLAMTKVSVQLHRLPIQPAEFRPPVEGRFNLRSSCQLRC